MSDHHFILTTMLRDRMPYPWQDKIFPTREEAVLAAKTATVNWGSPVRVTRVTAGGHWIDEVEVTDVSTLYLSTRKAEVKA